MSEYLWQYQIILLLYNCEICLNICTLSVCFWNMCPGAEVEYNDCVIHILTAMALIKHKHTQITTTQSARTPTDTSGLDHLHSTTSDNNNTQSIFFPFPQVCVCVCVLSLIPVIFSVPQLLGGQTYGGQNYHGACMPSQRPNRGISPIGSVVFHHTQTTTHTLTLARNAAWTSRRKQMHARKYTQMHVYTHTMTDCSSLIWCFSQWFISILWPGNCLRNTCSEKTHSDDLDQIEALPSATDNSGLEWRQNFKEREREGETASRQDVPQMIKQGELISTQWSARQKKYFALCVCVSLEWICTIQAVYIHLHQTGKAVWLYIHISPFVIWCCKLLCASHKSMQDHLKGKCFLFSLVSLWLLRKLVCKEDMYQKRSIYLFHVWGIIFFSSHLFCM